MGRKKGLMAVFIMAAIVLLLLCFWGNRNIYAETVSSFIHGFSIDIPNGWMRQNPKHEEMLLRYRKQNSNERFNLVFSDASKYRSIRQVPPSIFGISFFRHSEIKYREISDTDVMMETWFFKDEKLRKRVEGDERLLHFSIRWIRRGKMYTLTLSDDELTFNDQAEDLSRIAKSLRIKR